MGLQDLLVGLVKGFMIQFDPATHIGNGGGFSFKNPFASDLRPDGLPKFPVILFNYEPQYEIEFENKMESIGGSTLPFASKVFTGMEFPKLKVDFFLDVSAGREQPYSMQNVQSNNENNGRSVTGALNVAFNTKLSDVASQFTGLIGKSLLNAGVQPMLDKFEAIGKPSISFTGGSTLLPCILFLGIHRVYIGYVMSMNYRVLKTGLNGVPTRASGNFVFEVQPYLQYFIASKYNTIITTFWRVMNKNLLDLVGLNGETMARTLCNLTLNTTL